MAAKWQAMETAPRDRDFLVQLSGGYITRGRMVDGSVHPDRHFPGDVAMAWQELPTPWRPARTKRDTNEYTPEFLAFYSGFPTRKGESKFEALKAWRALGPVLQQQAVEAKPIYVQICRTKDPDYFPACAVWLRQRRFETLLEQARATPSSDAAAPMASRDDWLRRVGLYQKTHNWNPAFGPAPGSPGCKVPADILRQAGL